MVRHHLPPEYADPARAYLRAFLDEREAADAMHEVVEDVTYWGDDSLTSVLSATHAVLVSRMRITPEAAASWLVAELGLPADVAGAVTGGEADADADAPEPDLVEPVTVEPELVQPEPVRPEPVVPAAAPPDPAPSVEPLRIGFDEGPLPATLFDEPPSGSRVWLLGGMLVIGGLLLVAVLLITR